MHSWQCKTLHLGQWEKQTSLIPLLYCRHCKQTALPRPKEVPVHMRKKVVTRCVPSQLALELSSLATGTIQSPWSCKVSLQVSVTHFKSLFKILEHCHTWQKVSYAVCMFHSICFHDCVLFSASEQPIAIKISGWNNSSKQEEEKRRKFQDSQTALGHVNPLLSTLKNTQTTYRQAGTATKPCSVKRSAAEARGLQEQGAVQLHELCPLRSQRAMPHWRRIHCCSQKALQTLLS